jgi:hypothetical protein
MMGGVVTWQNRTETSTFSTTHLVRSPLALTYQALQQETCTSSVERLVIGVPTSHVHVCEQASHSSSERRPDLSPDAKAATGLTSTARRPLPVAVRLVVTTGWASAAWLWAAGAPSGPCEASAASSAETAAAEASRISASAASPSAPEA